MLKKKFAIFFSSRLKRSVGGPSGYLYNLREGLKEYSNDIQFIIPSEERYSVVHLCVKLLASMLPNRSIRKKIREKVKRLHIARVLNEISSVDILMCHSCDDLNLICEIWEKGYMKYPLPRLVLMSHSPTLPSLEEFEKFLYLGKEANSEHRREDVKAILKADLIVSPSRNAMNAYRKECKNLFDTKKIFYLPTGCPPLTKFNKDLMRRKFNIQTNFVICYVGRHWKVKGYDRIVEIADALLKEREDVTFLIAGKQNPAIPPLQHPRWIELGWANTAEVFSCSDVFLMPSQESYFDLVIIEALSVGLKCVLSKVGGNIDFKEFCPDIDLFLSNNEAISYINSYLSLSIQEKELIEKRLIKEFSDRLNEREFASRYVYFSKVVSEMF